MSARRRLRDDSDDEAPPRRSSQYFKEIQEQHRLSGKVLAAVEATPTRQVTFAAPASTVAPVVVAAVPSGPKKIFNGLIAAAPAPLSGSGSLNLDVLTSYVKAIKEDGVTAVYVNSTVVGEGFSLSATERMQIVERYVREGIQVCVHVTAPSLSETVALAKHAQANGVAAIAISVPCFVGSAPSLEDALDFINEVSHGASTVPLLVDYSACRSSYTLNELLSAAAARGVVVNLRGAVFSSYDLSDFAACLAIKGSVTDLLFGVEANVAGAAFLGATAFVGRDFSVVAPLFSKIVSAAQKGESANVMQLQQLLSKFQAAVSRAVGPGEQRAAAAAKVMASLRSSVEFGPLRPPGARLTVQQTSRLGDELTEFIKAYTALVKPSTSGSTKVSLKEMDGYTGKLNGTILERISYLSGQIGIRNLDSFFPHLTVSNGNWRRGLPLESECQPARYIDHTLLKAEGTRKEISTLCQEARTNNFYAVCVNGSRVAQCLDELRGSNVKVAAVIGFPLGAGTSKAKAKEARELIDMGAKEIDMVMNIGAMKDGNYRLVYEDVKAVVEASSPGIVKVIFETCLLSKTEIIDASILSIAAGAQFIKTSTGFNKAGATPEGLDIMLAVAGNEAEVKAAGGVRDFATAAAYISAGVRRIGTSSGVAIISGKPVGNGY